MMSKAYASAMLVVVMMVAFKQVLCETFMECENVPPGTFVPPPLERVKDCRNYLFCDGNRSFHDNCPANTYFNMEHQACDIDDDFVCDVKAFADNAVLIKRNGTEESLDDIITTTDMPPDAAAESSTKLTVTATTSTTTAAATHATKKTTAAHTSMGRPICERDIDELFAHEARCEYYYKCLYGYLTVLRCPLGYAYDHRQYKCLRIADAVCFKNSYVRAIDV